MIKSPDKRFLPGVLALIFLLTAALPGPALSQESGSGEQNVLRQASIKWMQVGIKQYQSRQFTDAEQSFRNALVFQKYLTEAERKQLNDYLAKAQTAPTTPEPALKQPQPADAPAKVEKPAESPPTQKVQPAKLDGPNSPAIPLTAETPPDATVTKDKDFKSQFMQLSDWLAANRANILMVGLPILAVLMLIAKFQARKRRPGTRVYSNPAIVSSSFIGAKLSAGRPGGKRHKDSHKLRPAPVPAANPGQKGFTQSLEHWRKHAINAPAAGKPFETSEAVPQRKDKFEDTGVPAGEVEKKLCGRCRELKPVTEFYKNKSTSDGLARWCKQCKQQYRKEHHSAKK
jgi:hypothetical protein